MSTKKETYFYLLDEITFADPDELWIAEGGDDLSTGDESQPLDTVEISVLDRHHTAIGEQLRK